MQSIDKNPLAPMQPQIIENALPANHKLEHYIINQILSGDDFSLTYKATDTQNDIPVIIKEYLPTAFASRSLETLDINPNTDDNELDYEWGVAQYFDEGSELIALNHPNIVNVKACIKAHNTVYVITDYIEGISLEAYAKGSTRSEEALLSLLTPLLNGLQAIHSKGFLHSDLTPSNILIQERTKAPIIINLGDVKHIFRNRKKEIAQVVSPGYSAYEQYHTHNNQGAWTDIYAMGCILYRIISGKNPESSMARLAATVDNNGQDILIPATQVGKSRYSQAFLSAIDHAIKLQRADRPESVSAWATTFKINGQPLVLDEYSTLNIEESIDQETSRLQIDFNLNDQPSATPNKHYRVIAAMVISMLVTIGGGTYYYQSMNNNKQDEYSDLKATSLNNTSTKATANNETIQPSFNDVIINSDFDVTPDTNSTSDISSKDLQITDSVEPTLKLDTTEAEVTPPVTGEAEATEASDITTVPSNNTNTTENNVTAPTSNKKDTTNTVKNTSPAKSQKKIKRVTSKKRVKTSVTKQLSIDKKMLQRLLQPPRPKQQHKKKTAKTKYQRQWEAKQKQQKHRAQWKKKKLAQLQRQKRLKQQQEIRKSRKNVKQIEDTLIGDKDW